MPHICLVSPPRSPPTHSAPFQDAIVAAVAEQIDVDESQVSRAPVIYPSLDSLPHPHPYPWASPSPPHSSQVIITDVSTNGEGEVVLTYVVTGVDEADMEDAAAALETHEVRPYLAPYNAPYIAPYVAPI